MSIGVKSRRVLLGGLAAVAAVAGGLHLLRPDAPGTPSTAAVPDPVAASPIPAAAAPPAAPEPATSSAAPPPSSSEPALPSPVAPAAPAAPAPLPTAASAASAEAELMAEVVAAYRGIIQRQLDEHRIDAKLETLRCTQAICAGTLVDGTAREYERWGEVIQRQISARSARSILLHQRRVDGRLQMHFTINIAHDIWTTPPPPAP